jgi:hypothetical protein
MRLKQLVACVALLVASPAFCESSPAKAETLEPHRFFRDQIGLTPQQIATIDAGNVEVKVLPAPSAAEVFIFGAVFVKGKPEDYVKLVFDMDRLRQVPGYLDIRRGKRSATPIGLSRLHFGTRRHPESEEL